VPCVTRGSAISGLRRARGGRRPGSEDRDNKDTIGTALGFNPTRAVSSRPRRSRGPRCRRSRYERARCRGRILPARTAISRVQVHRGVLQPPAAGTPPLGSCPQPTTDNSLCSAVETNRSNNNNQHQQLNPGVTQTAGLASRAIASPRERSRHPPAISWLELSETGTLNDSSERRMTPGVLPLAAVQWRTSRLSQVVELRSQRRVSVDEAAGVSSSDPNRPELRRLQGVRKVG